ncbi:transcription-silencing protein clr2 [Botryosphaeria dothidea]|uniref:Transcription-silencing protein clr2 n=1 Tax=Botryosphaeria dothidea TaxID=55169 RepID=A0A8H4N667_9PEZI|nr:transcription-silencing protein clr2 [Botryosphaeria dothidea]
MAPYAGTVVVPIEPYSDGDASQRPTRSDYTLQDPPTIYLEKLAESWMKERGEYHKALPRFKGKPRQVETSSVRIDDEGTPDIYRNLIDKLRRDGHVNEAIRETMSLDWQAERKSLPPLLDQLSQQGQWVPRPGEIVLFVRNLAPGTEICFDESTREYKVWSTGQERFGSHPRWEAGVVTQPAAELPRVGDLLIRLMPKQQGAAVTDVLKITSIKLVLMNLDTASDDDYDQKHPYNSAIHVTGKAFTSDPGHATNRIPLTDAERSGLPIESYEDEWYWMHDPERSLRIPFNRILGRCFEAEAMALWFPTKPSDYGNDQGQAAELSRGVEGMYRSRHYSSHNYLKIEKGKTWFWGDSRIEALDLATVNGQEVGKHDKSRDPKTWRKLIKIMEGNAGLEDRLALKKAKHADQEREEEMEDLPAMRKRPHSMMDRNAGTADVDMEDDEAAADQFVDELAGNIGLAQSNEEPADSDDGDVIVLNEAPAQSKKTRRSRLI